MLDPARLYASELASLCAPGERIEAAISVTYTHGQELFAEPARDRVSFDPLGGLDVPKWNRAAERFIGGVTLDARQGSDASSLVKANSSKVPMPTLVLTDARLLVANPTANGTAALMWERPLEAIDAVAWSPRPLQFGRLEILFRDRSIVRLLAGVLSPFATRRFVRDCAGRHRVEPDLST